MRPRTLLLVLCLVGTWACGGGMFVNTVSGDHSNIQGHHSFAVEVTHTTSRKLSPWHKELTEHVQESVAQTATARGYRQRPRGEADLLILVDVALTGYTDFNNLNRNSYRGGAMTLRARAMQNNAQTVSHHEAVLAFELLDAKAKQPAHTLLWRVSAKTHITEGGSAGQLAALVERALEQLPTP